MAIAVLVVTTGWARTIATGHAAAAGFADEIVPIIHHKRMPTYKLVAGNPENL
ncbi:MAG: hypothetical protein KIT25_05195 [Enhydrobacter sp.]|nr:MAG: hypothetical protein KIT25_05195 [Enhydrobacter sp.]